MCATNEPYGSFCKEIINLCTMRTANTAIKKFDCSKLSSFCYIKNALGIVGATANGGRCEAMKRESAEPRKARPEEMGLPCRARQ